MTTNFFQSLDIKTDFSSANNMVLWDFENCQIPVTNDASTIVSNIYTTLRGMGYNGYVEMIGYGSFTQIKSSKLGMVSKLDFVQSRGFTMIDIKKHSMKPKTLRINKLL